MAPAAGLSLPLLLAAAAALLVAVAPASASMLPGTGLGHGGSGCPEGTALPAKLALAAKLLPPSKAALLPAKLCVPCAKGSFSVGGPGAECRPCSQCPGSVCEAGLCSSVVNFDSVNGTDNVLFFNATFEGFFWDNLAVTSASGSLSTIDFCQARTGGGPPPYTGYQAASPPNVGVNALGDPLTFRRPDGAPFTLRSLFASAGYLNGMTLTVQGLGLGGGVVATATATVSTTARTFVDVSKHAGFRGVSAVRFATSGGVVSGLCGNRTQENVGLDNIVTSGVPPTPLAKAAAALRAPVGAKSPA